MPTSGFEDNNLVISSFLLENQIIKHTPRIRKKVFIDGWGKLLSKKTA